MDAFGNELVDHMHEVAQFCARWRVTELSVFGSAVRHELRLDSDIDLLVRFAPTADWDLLDIVGMREELESIFGRRVDLVERDAIENSDNWVVRREILGSAEVLYAPD